jgi:hypothetical protein
VDSKRASDIGVDTGPPDLDYRCHFIGPSGIVEGVLLFSAGNDASAALMAMEQLGLRARAMSVELWKGQRLIVRYSQPEFLKGASTVAIQRQLLAKS